MTTSLGPPVLSLDARIVQYAYGVTKLQCLQLALRKAAAANPPNNIILVHYIHHLLAAVFAINDQAFSARTSLLATYTPTRPVPVPSPPSTAHIPYDLPDTPVIPLEAAPTPATSTACLRLLDQIVANCLVCYQKRLEAAKKERNNDELVQKLTNLVSASFSDKFDNFADFTIESANNASLLIDIDIQMASFITKNLRSTIDTFKRKVHRLRSIKSQPADQQLSTCRLWPDSDLLLHKVLLWTIHLNDLYTVFRRFGRNIYLSNTNIYKRTKPKQAIPPVLIKEVDDLFNGSKKNGILIANLTRFIRANSVHENTVKNVLDFSNFVAQALGYLDTSVDKFALFARAWLVVEIQYREDQKVPYENLVKLKREVLETVEKTERTEKKTEPKKEPKKDLQKETIRSILPSSVLPPASQAQATQSIGSLTRTSSLTSNTSARPRNSIKPKPQPLASTVKRPTSMIFLGSNESLNTFHDAPSSPLSTNPLVPKQPPIRRRRSNSQPIPLANTPLSPGVRSPTGSIKRSSSLSKISPRPSEPTLTSKLLMVEEEPKAPKLTANQRLQQHIRQAAKSGSFMTQQKEVLSRVVFDPNDPSALHLRRKEKEKEENVEEESEKKIIEEKVKVKKEDSPQKSDLVQKPSSDSPTRKPLRTRDQVTKRNTEKNSRLSLPMESTSLQSSSPTPPSEVDSTAKKVRFTGVPEWTAAEDAPTKYANKILKNFAVFKPLTPALKKKDSMLKKEESFSFKQNAPEVTVSPAVSAAAAMVDSMATRNQKPTRLSKLKNKFI